MQQRGGSVRAALLLREGCVAAALQNDVGLA